MTGVTSEAPALAIRAARFEEVPEILRLVARAVSQGCRTHYDEAQRTAVAETYARALFVDVRGPFDSLVAEEDGRVVAFAQVDPSRDQLRALFVDASVQGRGVGRALLADVEARAWRHGCDRLLGAMSLNAVPFYAAAGFARRAPERLVMNGVPVPILYMDKRLRGGGRTVP